MAHAITNSGDYGNLIRSVSWIEASIAIFLLFARLYSSWRIVGRVRADFYIALATFVCLYSRESVLDVC